MTARSNNEEQSKTAHGQSLARMLGCLHLVCMLAACSDVERLIIPPRDPNDVDADGVPNDDDNCPETHNTDQHDEDRDGFGDACDVCPATFDDQGDFGEQGSFGFGDGVGDVCDPRPTRDGDVLQRFDTFAIPTDQYVGSGWTISADVARTLGDARFTDPRKLQGDGLLAQITVPLLVWLDGGIVEVSVNGDGVEEGAVCTIVHGEDGDLLIAHEIGHGTAMMPIEPVEAPFQLIAWRSISRSRESELRCIIGDVRLELALNNTVPAGTYAFASSGAITDIGSIAVYTFPINPCLQVPPTDGPNDPNFLRICDPDSD